MSENYESLTGATGRQRFFRPKRHNAKELFSGAPPKLSFDDEEFNLENISLTGIGCSTRQLSLENQHHADKKGILRLTQRGREIFRIPARIARISPTSSGAVIGLTLDEAGFDLPLLRRENARAISASATIPSKSTAIPAEYKVFCADVLNFVASYLQHIDRFYTPIENEISDKEKSALVMEMAQAAYGDWKALIAEGNKLVLPMHDDKKLRLELKAYTERVVTPEFLDGEGWWRSYKKPLGYPGDFQIMNYIYDGSPVGPTMRSKFLHQISLIGSSPVRSRMEELCTLISAETAKRSNETFEIMSIGCGPAREITDIAAKLPSDVSLRATLIDQDRDALDFAVANAHRAANRERLSINALNISFKDMLNPASIAGLIGETDIIYSAGLVDYLNPLLAQRFLRRVYQYLKPGGKLIIGNLNDLESGMIWPCEYVTDWSLYFRSEADMYAMAREIPESDLSLHVDQTKAIYFLIIEKPA